MARSIIEVLAIAQEFHSPEISRFEFCYGPRGEHHTRHSVRWHELHATLYEDRVFHCCECDKMVSYNDLETWICDFEDLENGCICSSCYEEKMGDDL